MALGPSYICTFTPPSSREGWTHFNKMSPYNATIWISKAAPPDAKDDLFTKVGRWRDMFILIWH
jgi:hypothetical protein